MPTRSHRSRRTTGNNVDVLAALASEIDDAFCDLTPDEPTQLLRVVAQPESQELELGLLPLERGDHPAHVMAGFIAPPEWTAVGVVTAGRSHELLEADVSERPTQPPRPIRLTFLLERSGAAITLLTPLGSPRSRRRVLHDVPIGLLPDACQRVLGLPTAPPSEGPELWLTACWLGQLLAAAIEHPEGVPTWEIAISHHPLISDNPPPAPETVASLAVQAAAQFDWERLRLLATRSQSADTAMTSAVAQWMDAGCFARHMLATELPVDVLLNELRALLPPAVMTAVCEALPPGRRSTPELAPGTSPGPACWTVGERDHDRSCHD